MSEVLRIGSRITALPVIHGSADCALEVRRVMLDQHFDCVAVPLPPSFRNDVLAALDWLPTPTLITQREAEAYGREWSPEDDLYDDSGDSASLSYVPIDPCQPVIAALRIAQGERLPCEFIDLETARFEPV